MKVVITSGTNFIGCHIVKYWIEKGAEVYIIDNLRSGFLKDENVFPKVKFSARFIRETRRV